ncbi:tyrosine-type recombinase/integrase [Listeria ilorinensis]|uniref:tyrosine-type recombinase/integrase n=1 Tax=Listeria ilorinensis TaxID=2867439 RepID=UPI001EF40498|nr:site-specific integrase [Listeria ilorinensis]
MGLTIKQLKEKKCYEWRARLYFNGRQHERSGNEKLKKTAEEVGGNALQELRREKKKATQGINAKGKDTPFEEFFLEWFEAVGKLNMTERSQKNRLSIFKKNVLHEIGHIPLSELNRLHYQKFINSLATVNGGPLSRGSIRDINSLVRGCLDYAVFDLRLLDFNVAQKIKIPQTSTHEEKREDEKNKYYTEKQLNTLLADEGEKAIIYDLITFLANTGLRISELTGLLEERYLPDEQAIMIDQQLIQGSARTPIKLDKLKTADSERKVYLDHELNMVIKMQLQKNKEFRFANPELREKQKYRFLFNMNGWPVSAATFRLALKRICERTGVPYHKKHPLHAFRHTHVKRLDEAGIPLTAIQQRIGHARGSQTTMVYKHADDTTRKNTIDQYTQFKKEKKIN